jgi:hypothetical protein
MKLPGMRQETSQTIDDTLKNDEEKGFGDTQAVMIPKDNDKAVPARRETANRGALGKSMSGAGKFGMAKAKTMV